MSSKLKQERYLSDTLRDKYLAELVKYKKTWFLDLKSGIASDTKNKLKFEEHLWGVFCVFVGFGVIGAIPDASNFIERTIERDGVFHLLILLPLLLMTFYGIGYLWLPMATLCKTLWY